MSFKQFNPETLTRDDLVKFLNMTSSIDGPFIEYYSPYEFGNSEVIFNVNQVSSNQFQFKNTYNQNKKYYALETSTMTVVVDTDNTIPLSGTEYYYLQWQKTSYFSEQKLFGNNLGALPSGFSLGATDGRLYVYISKQNVGSVVTEQPINVQYVNNTSDNCAYRLEYSYSSQDYQYSDSVFTLYSNFGNCFYVYASADLTSQPLPIFVTVYDNSTNSLLYTTQMNGSNNNINSWVGQHCNVTDIRIEFNY